MDGDLLKTIITGIFTVLAGLLTARVGYIQYRDKFKADMTVSNTTDRENERQDLASTRKFVYDVLQQGMGELRVRVMDLEKKNSEVTNENLSLRQDNAELRDRVADLEKEKEALRSEMAAIERQHNMRIAEMEKQIADLQAIIGKMNGDMK